MKRLPFDAKHVVDIIEKRKTATVRRGWGRDIEPGDDVVAVTDKGYIFGRLQIQRMVMCEARDAMSYLEEEDAAYGARTTNELIRRLREYYDDIEPGTKVTIYFFERT